MDHSLSFLHVRGGADRSIRRSPLTNGFHLAEDKK